jgi:uncharacterized membrane protein YfcA
MRCREEIASGLAADSRYHSPMPAVGVLGLCLLALVALVGGGVAAVSGFGIGSLLTPALAVAVGTKAAVAVVAVPHAVATSVRLWGLRASVDRGVLKTFGLASAVGGLAGAILYSTFANPFLTVVLGVLLVLTGLSELVGWARRLDLSGPSSLLAGAASGLFGGLVGNQGGIRSAALLRLGLSREAIVATATATALMVDAARLPVYVVTSGAEMLAYLPVVAVLTTAVVVGTLLGVPILRRLPESHFRRLLALLLILLGLSLIASVVLQRGP